MSETPASSVEVTRPTIVFLVMTVVLDSMGIGIIIPVTPALLTDVLPGVSLAEAAIWGGLLASIYAAMQFVFGPILGSLSDQIGRKPILLVSLLVMAFYYLAMGFAQTIWLLFVARIIGGITSIARAAAVIVPFMAGIYILGCLVIISMSWENIPIAIESAVSGAFGSDAMAGGALGALIIGFQRALFSNEAGLGSASIAHSAVKTKEPASEGLVGLLEPFIDTVVVLTLSSLVILTTAVPNGLMGGELAGIELTSAAFAYHLPWAPYLIACAAVLFAFSTALAWSYYGLTAWNYLVGIGKWRTIAFQATFLTFFALGCVLELRAVLDFSDAMIFLIAVPNLIALYLFAPMVKREVEGYLQDAM